MDNKLFNDLKQSVGEAKLISEGKLEPGNAFAKKEEVPKPIPLNLPAATDLELTPPTESEFVNIWEGGKRTAMFRNSMKPDQPVKAKLIRDQVERHPAISSFLHEHSLEVFWNMDPTISPLVLTVVDRGQKKRPPGQEYQVDFSAFGPKADIDEETQKLFSKPLTGAAASYGIPRGEIDIVSAATPPEASKLTPEGNVPYSMYVDEDDVASAEDLMGRLKHHVKLLERSFSLGQPLVLAIHLSGVEALVKGIKKYSEQLPGGTFADMFKEDKPAE